MQVGKHHLAQPERRSGSELCSFIGLLHQKHLSFLHHPTLVWGWAASDLIPQHQPCMEWSIILGYKSFPSLIWSSVIPMELILPRTAERPHQAEMWTCLPSWGISSGWQRSRAGDGCPDTQGVWHFSASCKSAALIWVFSKSRRYTLWSVSWAWVQNGSICEALNAVLAL